MNRPLLSAALIARNEERFLWACLTSLKDVADDVVVIDTGSNDRTRQIALNAGARVFDFPWIGDFSAARNRALDEARGEWVLYIDADERVRPGTADSLRRELSSASHIGYRVLLHPLHNHTSYWSLRLFRNDPSIRFRGIIHESTWPSLHDYHRRRGGDVGQSRMILDHDGYEDNQEAKNARNLPMLLRSLEQDPGRVYCWCHLANIYSAMERHDDAREAWLKAVAIVRKYGPRAPEDLLAYIGLIEDALRFDRDVEPVLEEASSLFPRSIRLEWLRGRLLMKSGRLDEAIHSFQNLVERGKNGDIDRLAAYNLRLFDSHAYDAIGTCHFRLRNYSESRYYYSLAVQHEPEQLEYRVKEALSLKMALRAQQQVASAGQSCG